MSLTIPFGGGVTEEQIRKYAAQVWAHEGSPWYMRCAARAIRDGWVLFIPGRLTNDVYLVRLWLSQPKVDIDGEFDSGKTTMLHYFPRGDDDQSLHDHPMDFTSTILAGGYEEHLPPEQWRAQYVKSIYEALNDTGINISATERVLIATERAKTLPGPAWDRSIHWRLPNDVITRWAGELHCVGNVLPGTFTLVQTGPKQRRWGFWPPGKPWMYWKDHVEALKALEPST